ncbi:BTB/POZ and TAZ domain-containing protein 4-like [Salvia hispanica]|uniref:BTB/POZ and TAZ domain-containing protein 4-like n=1 Tax=Salvia hispanica TaxID=49212 RepID=UPI0020093CBC|nr:BTB/POZ and TAZ domain-containing protein 4-like [Salvia hispanica]
MNCKNQECSLPLPPPFPSQRIGLLTSGLTKRENCFCAHNAVNTSLDRLFDEAYRADISVSTEDGGIIYAHASILGMASPVFKAMLTKLKGRGQRKRPSILIPGVPSEAVRVFIRFLYSSCYEEEKMREFAMHLLVLSHAYAVGQLKRLCEHWLETKLINSENVVDIFQLALLCDAPRLSIMCHRFIVTNIKAVQATDGWQDMRTSHPVLEKELMESLADEDAIQKDRKRKQDEKKMYMQLYEAMEALVHICRDGCQTIGPHDKALCNDQGPCEYSACKGLEALVRHFAGCKTRGTGGCSQCKRMWRILELHSRLCPSPDDCRVPLCRKFRQRRKQNKKEDVRWRILVKKIVRSKSITGAPFLSLDST